MRFTKITAAKVVSVLLWLIMIITLVMAPLVGRALPAAASIAIPAIAAGMNDGYALKSDGTVWAWGDNEDDELGNGLTPNYNTPSTLHSDTPVQVSNLSNVTAIAAGMSAAYALNSDGTVWAWGSNYGGLGNGVNGSSNIPVQVSNLTGAIAIAAGGYAAYALKSDGTVWGWGEGPLGNNTYLDSNIPVQVSNLTDVIAIAAGGSAGYALTTDGTVWGWGQNVDGQLGFYPDPGYQEQIPGVTYSNVPVRILSNTLAIAGGGADGYALKSDGTVWAYGDNGYDELGNGSASNPYRAAQVSNLTGATAIAGGCYIGYALEAGSVWDWGFNCYGQLGNGSTVLESDIPVEASNLTNVIAIASGGSSGYALKSDGTVWDWGFNCYGQLGNGLTTNSSVPVQLSRLNLLSPTQSPTITSPVYAGTTSVSGTSVVDASIVLYDGATQIGSAISDANGTWTVTGLTLTTGDSLTATALASGDTVSPPSPAVIVAPPGLIIAPTAVPGTAYGTTAVMVTPNTTGDTLAVQVSTSSIATPNMGDSAPTGSGATNPYTSGGSISGVSACDYVGVYELGSSETVVAFTQIQLASGDINSQAPSAQTINPNGGTITTSDTVGIDAALSAGQAIYYTINPGNTGSMPTVNSSVYSIPFIVSATAGTFTVEAVVYDPIAGMGGAVAATFTVSAPSGGGGIPSSPTISPDGGTFTSAQIVYIGNPNGNSVSDCVYYTTSDSTSTNSSTDEYTGPFTVDSTETVEAVVYDPTTGLSSAPALATFTITTVPSGGGITAPTINPNGGNIASSETVGIGNIASGSNAYYTITSGTTGTMPTVNSSVYSIPFIVSATAGTFTVDAAVYDSVHGGWSDPASATFTVTPATVAPVTGVTLSKTTDNIAVGATDQLTATIIPTNATNQILNWTSSNTAVATVDQTGKVTAVGEGTASITATTDGSNITAPCAVNSIMYGDINGTGKINSGDATLVLRYCARLTTLASSQLIAAEVNGGSNVNSGDATLILRYAARLISTFPAQQ
jgi:alpha-tubulin suppressor-like RCC1 family protein/uncharacterized protein YjdB